MPIPNSFDYCRFIIYFEIKKHDTSGFFLETALAIQGHLWLHSNFLKFISNWRIIDS